MSRKKVKNDSSVDKLVRWFAPIAFAGLLGLSSWTLATLLDLRDLAKANLKDIETINTIHIKGIKQDIGEIKGELKDSQQGSETQARLFQLLTQLEMKVHMIR